MPTLVATVGSASANSYVSVADGTVYFDERLDAAAWTAATADDKARALIMATRRIDREEFEGEKTATGQALKWPRVSAFDPDGYEYDSDSIPQIVQDATCEMALVYLDAGTSTGETGLEGFKRVKVGPIEVEADTHVLASSLPDEVRRILRPVLVTSGSIVRVMRG